MVRVTLLVVPDERIRLWLMSNPTVDFREQRDRILVVARAPSREAPAIGLVWPVIRDGER